MNQRLASTLVVAALCAAPLAARAEVLRFNADLLSSQENPPPAVASQGSGNASLFYNTQGTPSLADDRYSFVMWATGLSSNPVGFHIHGAATPTENAPVRIDLTAPPFTALQDAGGTLIVTGIDAASPTIPATDLAPPGPANPNGNAGHPAMSFLEMLQSQLAYVNVHTSLNPGGEIRGQLTQVAAPIPEPMSYALLVAGLGLISVVVRRRALVSLPA
jgi:hypothetical protein